MGASSLVVHSTVFAKLCAILECSLDVLKTTKKKAASFAEVSRDEHGVRADGTYAMAHSIFQWRFGRMPPETRVRFALVEQVRDTVSRLEDVSRLERKYAGLGGAADHASRDRCQIQRRLRKPRPRERYSSVSRTKRANRYTRTSASQATGCATVLPRSRVRLLSRERGKNARARDRTPNVTRCVAYAVSQMACDSLRPCHSSREIE